MIGRKTCITISAFLIAAVTLQAAEPVIWATPSKESLDSMPLSARDFFPASNWMKTGVFGLDLTGRDMAHFDLARFADQCADMGVTFVCCGTGQNSGYYNGPNPVYETIAGYPVGSKCNPADIPRDFSRSWLPAA